ncbi:MAG: hypothetical protein HY308_09410 [Gammaproteobacteria bacterium]|nr:hypothetical protein [Gammaproteobacteria bacterium]
MKIIASFAVAAWLIVGAHSLWPFLSGEVGTALEEMCSIDDEQKAQGIQEQLKRSGLPAQPEFDCAAFKKATYSNALIHAVLVLVGLIAAVFAIFSSRRRAIWLLVSAAIYLSMWGWKVIGKNIVELYRVMFALADSSGQFIMLLGLEVVIPLLFVAVLAVCAVTLMRKQDPM